jgi:hypothetical protein
MATQYQQVLAAIKDLEGKGTVKEIYAKIKETNPDGWKTKTPLASISGYLSTNGIHKDENGIWTLPDNKAPEYDAQSDGKKETGKQRERGLYFITLSPYINIHGAGFLFKVGQSGDTKERLKGYSASLPVDTIQLISFYPIPGGIDLAEAEKEVTGELRGNENLGEGVFEHKISVRPYLQSHQEEWLQTLDISLSNKEDLNRLANIIDGIVKTTIETLTPRPKEDPEDG